MDKPQRYIPKTELFILSSVTRCSPLAIPENGYLSTTLTEFGINVFGRCNEGYIFGNKSEIEVTTCLISAQWTAVITSCQGKNNIIKKMSYKVKLYIFSLNNIYIDTLPKVQLINTSV